MPPPSARSKALAKRKRTCSGSFCNSQNCNDSQLIDLSADIGSFEDLPDDLYVNLNTFVEIADDGDDDDSDEIVENPLDEILEAPEAVVMKRIQQWRPKFFNCNVRGAGTSRRSLQRTNQKAATLQEKYE